MTLTHRTHLILWCAKYFVYQYLTHKQYLQKKEGNNSHNEQHIEALRLSWSFVWLKNRLKKSSPILPGLVFITSSKEKNTKKQKQQITAL